MIQQFKSLILCLFFTVFFSQSFNVAQTHYPGQHNGKLKLNDRVRTQAYSFDLKDVRLLPSPFKANMERAGKWMLDLSVERLVHSFLTNAGMYAGHEGGYFTVKKLGGWESLDSEVRGHSIGHLLSGLALVYASTGNEIYKMKSDSIVRILADVQKTLDQGGYLSAYPQELINRNLAGQRVWAPWYTQHKLFSSMIDQYLYCDNELALEIVSGMAAWAYEKLRGVSENQRAIMLRNEFGGMNDSFYTLYAITGDPMHKWLGDFFYHDAMLDPLLAGDDILADKHANTFIPKLIGVARAYQLEGKQEYKDIASFFWQTVIDHHSFATGSNSDRERFFNADEQAKHLTGYTGESCNVYNMLKLTKHIYSMDPDVKYMDYYELALFNHILGQQDPVTGMISYFLPFLPGAHKVYSTFDESFWCCVGTSFENQAKFGESIYVHDGEGVYVNLFIPSVLNWKEKGIQFQQETRFPADANIRLKIGTEKNNRFPIHVRFPSWAGEEIEIKINGRVFDKMPGLPGDYITLDRIWRNGDQIEITFEMALHLVQAGNDPHVNAIAYGPIVLAAQAGKEGMMPPAPFSNPTVFNDYYNYDYRIPNNISNVLPVGNLPVSEWVMKSDKGDLRFMTNPEITGKEHRLIPIFELHRERHIIYWSLE